MQTSTSGLSRFFARHGITRKTLQKLRRRHAGAVLGARDVVIINNLSFTR